MHIDRATLEKIADEARLELDQESAQEMHKDINQILDWIEKLQEIDTTGIEPLISMSQEGNKLREDEVVTPPSQEVVLCNAPQKDSDYFKVPKVK